MTLGERCDEIVRLIDEALDAPHPESAQLAAARNHRLGAPASNRAGAGTVTDR